MTFRILNGDVLEHLPRLEANSFDACLCDPPYGLSFMGKEWDHGVPAADTWREVYRCLKPGAFLLAFGGTRTYHRLACAIEDAGFEIRDCLSWMYGQGFPKSLDISKALDKAAGVERKASGEYVYPDGIRRASTVGANTTPFDGGFGRIPGSHPLTAPATDAARQWQGYGTALKPAWEPIIVAMEPLAGTFAQNATEWGVAGINVDGCRIRHGEDTRRKPVPSQGWCISSPTSGSMNDSALAGRWPANVLLSHSEDCREVCAPGCPVAMLDAQSGERRSSCGGGNRLNARGGYSGLPGDDGGRSEQYYDTGGASRFFYVAKASRREREAGLREAGLREAGLREAGPSSVWGGEEDDLSEGKSRVLPARNHHPTVKPIAVAEWLAKLILPPARETPRRLLVPFSGSGSEMAGALNAGWDEVVGIERETEYVEIANARIPALRKEPEKKQDKPVTLPLFAEEVA